MTQRLFPLKNRLIIIAIFAFLFTACGKKDVLVDLAYPDQQLYMSQAATAGLGPGANGVYSITANIEGQPQRFKADVAGGKFIVPLGIIKSGVSKAGTFTVTVSTNTDTIGKLITAGKFTVLADPAITTETLPASAYTLPANVTINDDSTYASFNASINLGFLVSSATLTPKKRYALAVGISYSAKSSLVKTSLATTVIFIDPVQVIMPVANFTSYIYPVTKTANFFNTSANAASYSWSFGDGSPVATDAFPNHIYAASGTYTVTLTTTGITGTGTPSVKTTTVVIP